MQRRLTAFLQKLNIESGRRKPKQRSSMPDLKAGDMSGNAGIRYNITGSGVKPSATIRELNRRITVHNGLGSRSKNVRYSLRSRVKSWFREQVATGSASSSGSSSSSSGSSSSALMSLDTSSSGGGVSSSLASSSMSTAPSSSAGGGSDGWAAGSSGEGTAGGTPADTVPVPWDSIANDTVPVTWDTAAANMAAANVPRLVAGAARAKRRKDRFLLPALFFPTEQSLSYLDGSLPGDAGFDPLGLFDPANASGFINQRFLQTSEVVHSRWAMLGAVGCLAPEVLASAGALPPESDVVWFRTDVVTAIEHPQFTVSREVVVAIQVAFMATAEVSRLREFLQPGAVSRFTVAGRPVDLRVSPNNPGYPGGAVFNFADFVSTETALAEYKDIEIVQGRFAMLALVGYVAQAAVTGEGPYQNLIRHLEDPLRNNVVVDLIKFNSTGAH